jgi:salicyloyl-CoA 5-hydroxylase
MRVVCVGAGPGGLYAALLLKRRRPQWDVVVVERNGPDETFGFGVVFSEPTLERLKTGDPATYRSLLGIAKRWDPIELRLRGDVIRCSGQGFVGVGRHALLSLLRSEASAAGVELRFHDVVNPEALPEADILVAADGASSTIRRRFAATFEPTVEIGRSKFIWFGTSQRFDSLTFLFAQNDDGAFAAHVYPFSDERSTFIVETDDESLQKAGLDGPDREATERLSMAYCERTFADHLGGQPLLANKSRWASFRTVRCAAWRAARVVLIGDAAHTAHFSMGSGTKMALEDALALADALCAGPDVDEALANFEAARRPEVRKVQQAARPSLFWWENFRHVMGRDIEPFAFHFLTRNMRVTRDSLVRRDPGFAKRIEAWHGRKYGGDGAKGARGLPLAVGPATLRNRLVSEGPGQEADVGLALLSLAELDRAGPGSSDRQVGVRLDEQELTAGWLDAPLVRARADWLEVAIDLEERGLRIVEQARTTWTKPLSVRIQPGGRAADDVVRFALRVAQAGADVVTLSWRGKEQPDVIACAEGLRFGSSVLIAVDAQDAADPDTLVLSGRADLCFVRRDESARA